MCEPSRRFREGAGLEIPPLFTVDEDDEEEEDDEDEERRRDDDEEDEEGEETWEASTRIS